MRQAFPFCHPPILHQVHFSPHSISGLILWPWPVKKLDVRAGISPTFYFNHKPERVYISFEPLIEPFYQAQRIHRKMSINYSLRIRWTFFGRFAISVIQQGHLTGISKSVLLGG